MRSAGADAPLMDLPELTDEPNRHPDCCLSLSTKLLTKLTDTFRPPQPTGPTLHVLSVGSGTGLLEALLQAHWSSAPSGSNLTIHGVEVRAPGRSRPVNRYLRDGHASTVRGTWEVSPAAAGAGALLFVYPREPGLVARYVRAAGEGLRLVVWLGPNVDWALFEACLADAAPPGGGGVEVVGGSGLADYETMAIVRMGGRDVKG